MKLRLLLLAGTVMPIAMAQAAEPVRTGQSAAVPYVLAQAQPEEAPADPDAPPVRRRPPGQAAPEAAPGEGAPGEAGQRPQRQQRPQAQGEQRPQPQQAQPGGGEAPAQRQRPQQAQPDAPEQPEQARPQQAAPAGEAPAQRQRPQQAQPGEAPAPEGQRPRPQAEPAERPSAPEGAARPQQAAPAGETPTQRQRPQQAQPGAPSQTAPQQAEPAAPAGSDRVRPRPQQAQPDASPQTAPQQAEPSAPAGGDRVRPRPQQAQPDAAPRTGGPMQGQAPGQGGGPQQAQPAPGGQAPQGGPGARPGGPGTPQGIPQQARPGGQQPGQAGPGGQQPGQAGPGGQRPGQQRPGQQGPGQAQRPANIPVSGDANVISRESDRVIIREGNQVIIRKDEQQRLGQQARDMTTRQLGNGLTEVVVVRPDGTRIVTIRTAQGDILRRARVLPDGREVVLIDSMRNNRQPNRRPVATLEAQLPPLAVRIPRDQYIVETRRASPTQIREALLAPPVEEIREVYTLDEVRQSERVRDMVRRVDVDTITFETGSWTIGRDQIASLAAIGTTLEEIIRRNPDEIYLVEGHTDAVGSDLSNLELSDRRAESVAITLSTNWNIPPENLVTQGYGEQYLKVPTEAAERANRRVTLRRITPLVQGQQQ
ncbi:OmpA family protein [Faunimonas sp. B44]|uniref:OmpA family protein n=1 Tax=Faunimonas sp. B44 TaxID=3461493 RepID=UPI004043BCBD